MICQRGICFYTFDHWFGYTIVFKTPFYTLAKLDKLHIHEDTIIFL